MAAKKPAKAVRRPQHAAASKKPAPAKHVAPKDGDKPSAWSALWARVDKRKLAIWAGAVVLVAIFAFFPIALASDQPSFCRSCHGMQPFYAAWQTGKHKDVGCIDCHVDAGYPSRFLHKFVALREVYNQFFSSATFPNYNADMPDSRCLRCHADIATKSSGQFSHGDHLSRGVKCATCHATTGHQVSFAALDSAGVLNRNMALPGLTFVGEQTGSQNAKPSVLAGHKPVVCSNCHDQAGVQCSFCHTPPSSHYGADCKLCHRPSVPFAQFTHPKIPAPHGVGRRPCVACHPNGFTTVYCSCHKGNPPKED